MQSKQKIQILEWWDILIIATILFSGAIFSSTLYFIELINNGSGIMAPVDFSAEDNYRALLNQSFLLAIALTYLILRNFDFSVWIFHVSFKYLVISIAIFIFVAFLMDIYIWFLSILFYDDLFNEPYPAFWGTLLSDKNISVVLYSILNGTYEEIFFIGICLCVEMKNIKKAFLFSLLIRFGFHTYQGLYIALGISFILGITYFILYTKFNLKNLFPYFVSHIIADIFGMGILRFFVNFE